MKKASNCAGATPNPAKNIHTPTAPPIGKKLPVPNIMSIIEEHDNNNPIKINVLLCPGNVSLKIPPNGLPRPVPTNNKLARSPAVALSALPT